MSYTELKAASILKTLRSLRARIAERFPERGLSNVCGELLELSERHVKDLETVMRPNLGLRALVTLVLALGLGGVGFGIAQKIRLLQASPNEIYSFEGVEAIANITLLMAGGIWFLLNLEARMKRHAALQSLHELRSIAHVIDMHQLTKDPAMLTPHQSRTKSSPERDLTPFELVRYLDYCAEMMSIIGKVAALYMQKIHDPVVIATANDIETLTSGFSQKIWQKIMIVEGEAARHRPSTPPSSLHPLRRRKRRHNLLQTLKEIPHETRNLQIRY
jgi:hypothetical protein